MADSGYQWAGGSTYSNDPYSQGSPFSSTQAPPYLYHSRASATSPSTQPTSSYVNSLPWESPVLHESDIHYPIEEDTSIQPEHLLDPQLMSTCVGSPVSVEYQDGKPSQAVNEAFYDELPSTSEQQIPLYNSSRMQHDAYSNIAGSTQLDNSSPYQDPQLPLYQNAAAPAVNSGQGTSTFAQEPFRLPTKCDNCQKLFKEGKYAKRNLGRHVRRKHPSKPTTYLVCLGKKNDGSKCNTKFVNWNNVPRHLRDTHKMAIASNPGRKKVDRTSFEHMFKEVPRSPLTVEADESDTSEWLENGRIPDIN